MPVYLLDLSSSCSTGWLGCRIPTGLCRPLLWRPSFLFAAAYLNWALCLVASALFVPFLCRHNPRADIRVLIAAAYLGLGTIFPFGLSSSAPLILATPGNPLMQPATGSPIVDRLVPVTETLFAPFNLGFALVMAAVGFLAVVALHPRRGAVTLSPEQIQEILPKPPEDSSTPAGRIDRFPGWVLLAAILIGYPLGHSMVNRGFGTTWTINAYNMTFLVAALLLHRRPASFVNACRQGVGTTWGIILQFPFYAGIFGVMNNTGLGNWLGQLFADFLNHSYLPAGCVHLFGVHESLCSLRRVQVADRSAIPHPGRARARSLGNYGSPRLCLWRRDDQPHPTVLGNSYPGRGAAAIRRDGGLHISRGDGVLCRQRGRDAADSPGAIVRSQAVHLHHFANTVTKGGRLPGQQTGIVARASGPAAATSGRPGVDTSVHAADVGVYATPSDTEAQRCSSDRKATTALVAQVPRPAVSVPLPTPVSPLPTRRDPGRAEHVAHQPTQRYALHPASLGRLLLPFPGAMNRRRRPPFVTVFAK